MHVSLARHGGVLHAVLNNPPANQLSPVLLDGLNEALGAFVSGPAKTLVISSGIDGFFAAGADIKKMADLTPESFAEYRDALRAPMQALAGCGRPTIAAIDGLALGGGLELAMACTLRFAAPDARLGLPEVKLGLIPGAGGTQRLPLLVGRGRALEIMLSGREVSGREGASIGLVDRLVEGDVTADALVYARRLAQMSPLAVAAILACVEAAGTVSDRGMAVEGEAVVRLFEGGDAREALAAFVEQRAG
jgi:enoyl-CoA hydratase